MTVEFGILIVSLLFFVSIFSDKLGSKFGVPALLLFLIVGMLFGEEGFSKWLNLSSYMNISVDAAQVWGTVALCVILFSGGLDTSINDIRPVAGPGVTLATIGVLITALVTGTIIYFVFGWIHAFGVVTFATALLMASTMSSTDSASVFSVMRTNGISLKHNLRPLLELESGANDPMAYVLTITLIGIVTATEAAPVSVLSIFQTILVQLIVGGVLGFVFGKIAVYLLRKVQLQNESLYPIMIFTFCLFSFAATYFLKGNGYLAVYISGLVIGNTKFTRKRQTKTFFDGFTWLLQLVLFLVLGLMVKPSSFLQLEVWLPCLIISIVTIFISRPLAVWLSLLPFGQQFKNVDKFLVSWVGLKGAVPIIFAILCKASGVPNADLIFNVVFLCTLVSLLVQGTSLSKMAFSLHLATPNPPQKRLQYFDIDLPDEIQSTASEVVLTEKMLVNGNQLKDLKFATKALVIMVRRGEDFFVPAGTSVLNVGDQLLVITDRDARAAQKHMEEEEEFDLNQWGNQIMDNLHKKFERQSSRFNDIKHKVQDLSQKNKQKEEQI